MVFITKANHKKLLGCVRSGQIEGLDFGDLYKVDLCILSKYEKIWLAKAREFFRNFDMFVHEVYLRREVEDTYTYLYEGTHPSFHCDYKCEVLHSKYNNVSIPDEIIKRGKVSVVKFRRWFEENKKLEGEKFIFALKMEFNIFDPNLKYFESPNSGVDEFENINLEEVVGKIDDILNKADRYFGALSEYQQREIMDAERFNADSNNESVIIWRQLKKDLKKNMLVYFRVKFNPELTFVSTLLEQIGFRQCQKCAIKVPVIDELDDDLPF